MSDNPCEVATDPELSDQIAERYQTRMKAMGQSVADGSMSPDDFQQNMEDLIRLSFLHQSTVGSPTGDPSEITPTDRDRIQSDIAEQYNYLDGFMDDIHQAQKDGKPLTFVAARAALYGGAAKSAYWHQAMNSVDLPTMPGEQQCAGNCQCQWDLQCENDENGNPTAVNAYWRRSAKDSCPDCVANEQMYNPLRIEL